MINLSAKLSSQYVSSILLSAPYALKDVQLRIKGNTSFLLHLPVADILIASVTVGEAVSQPFIDMTIKVMQQFGVRVIDMSEKDKEGKQRISWLIPQGVYHNPKDFVVEPDASSASYPLALAAITGGEVTVDNIGSTSVQGDAQFYTVMERMGCSVKQTETSTTVQGTRGQLFYVEVMLGSNRTN